MQNTGALTITVKSIKIDGFIFPCRKDYRGKFKINNC
jgi:hypothetical protein